MSAKYVEGWRSMTVSVDAKIANVSCQIVNELTEQNLRSGRVTVTRTKLGLRRHGPEVPFHEVEIRLDA